MKEYACHFVEVAGLQYDREAGTKPAHLYAPM